MSIRELLTEQREQVFGLAMVAAPECDVLFETFQACANDRLLAREETEAWSTPSEW